MKIFLAGATGAIGQQLVPLLVSGGHQVIASTRTPDKMARLREAGARPVVMDGLKRDDVIRAVTAARPDVIVHQMTALTHMKSLKRFDDEFAMTNRLRTEGTIHLLEAARAAGVGRFVAQSYTNWTNVRAGGRIKTEDDLLDPTPPKTMRQTIDAIRRLDELVFTAAGITGIVLRYGNFYGPGTSVAPGGDIVEAVRRRQFPIVGNGAGVWSFIHIADAANAARIAIERGPSGIYNIVDDEPAEESVWLPDLADAIGAQPPRHVPAWLGRLLIGDSGISMMTQMRGSSNAKAKRVLNWQPLFASWRDGFRRGFASAPQTMPLPTAV
jgi:nucleoside-diphosphate-sugar epimerase